MTRYFFVEPWFFLALLAAIVVYRVGRNYIRPAWILLTLNVLFISQFTQIKSWGLYLAIFAITIPILAAWVRRGAAPKRTRLLLVLGGILMTLALFRYPSFFSFSQKLSLPSTIEWMGISYLTFRAIDLVIVTARATKPPDWLASTAYLTFFVPYVAGPVNRFSTFMKDITVQKPLTFVRARANLLRAALGMLKIFLLSRWAFAYSVMAPGYAAPASFADLTVGLYCYLLYIYLDFSGYCDVAISVADFLDIKVPENFRNPLFASNLQDFWNRWHISLSHFCRDYIFFPLLRTLSKKGAIAASAFAILVTFTLIGLWHGDSLHWVLYGLLHGVGLAWVILYRHALGTALGEKFEKLEASWAYRSMASVLTLHFVVFSLLLTLDFKRMLSLFTLL